MAWPSRLVAPVSPMPAVPLAQAGVVLVALLGPMAGICRQNGRHTAPQVFGNAATCRHLLLCPFPAILRMPFACLRVRYRNFSPVADFNTVCFLSTQLVQLLLKLLRFWCHLPSTGSQETTSASSSSSQPIQLRSSRPTCLPTHHRVHASHLL